MRLRRGLLFAALALLTVVNAGPIDGEDPNCKVPRQKKCGSSQDFYLVVDTSSSIASLWNDFITFLEAFANQFDLDDRDPLSPRLGLIGFFGYSGSLCDLQPTLCAACYMAKQAGKGCLSSKKADFIKAIKALEPPGPNVLTCVSCGIELALKDNPLIDEVEFESPA